jgi:BCD family chlorophyll transporter-like MFS transporter
MRYLKPILQMLSAVLKTFRLALPKIGVGWMFALLTIDFNRIAIVELGVTSVLITTMLAMHYFLSPFQVIVGRIADHHPVGGWRRTPYLLLGSTVASLVFLALPRVVHAMGAGSLSATVAGFGLLILFGISIAIMGDSHHSLIAEVVSERARGGVISVVWTFTILSTILAAVVMNIVRPEYSPEAMQRLYNLTPFIVIGSALLGVIGMEKRLRGAELAASVARAKQIAPPGNPLRVAYNLLQEDRQTRGFFVFIFVAIFAIFLQDNILEVFGAEVFGMTIKETTSFQPTWGGGVLLGMILMGVISVVASISKKRIALIGCFGTAVGMATLATAALTQQVELVKPALFGMGLFTGFFNVGALSMMMDMTVEGATGLYMGLWGVAQAFGNGSSSIGSGLLHSTLIEQGLMAPNTAYFAIFGLEAVGMTIAAIVLLQLSVKRFHELHDGDLTRHNLMQAMEAGAAA